MFGHDRARGRLDDDQGAVVNGIPLGGAATVGAITVTAQATSSPDRHDKQGSGDFYLAISGDLHLATNGDW